MATLLVSIAVLMASALLFKAALPTSGRARRFVGTVWEPYIVVALVTAFVVSFGLAVWSIAALVP